MCLINVIFTLLLPSFFCFLPGLPHWLGSSSMWASAAKIEHWFLQSSGLTPTVPSNGLGSCLRRKTEFCWSWGIKTQTDFEKSFRVTKTSKRILDDWLDVYVLNASENQAALMFLQDVSSPYLSTCILSNVFWLGGVSGFWMWEGRCSIQDCRISCPLQFFLKFFSFCFFLL